MQMITNYGTENYFYSTKTVIFQLPVLEIACYKYIMNIKQIYWVFCKLNFLQFYITCIFIAHRIRHICSCEKIIAKKQRKMEKQKKIHKNRVTDN